MPNIANVLKDEISRLARKELKSNTDSLKKAVSSYRSEIAALKRRVDVLERQAKKTAKASARSAPVGDETEGPALRFRASGFAQHRQRLGLSAKDAGLILGASALSVYKWESGKAAPRGKFLPAIARLRKMGKREAAARLAELQGA